MKGMKGFSLMELAIVLAIIAVLAGILIPVMRGYQTTAEYRAAQVGVNQVAAAMAVAYTHQPAAGGWTPDEVFERLHEVGGDAGGPYISRRAFDMGYRLVVRGDPDRYNIERTVAGRTFSSGEQLVPEPI